MSIGCRDLRVHAGRRELLHVPGLAVPAGATLAVLGPNGAGKSTLLRALGMLGPHRVSGEILLDGRPATAARMRACAAAVLQRPILRRGTVGANVASGLRFHGARGREARERAEPWLRALGIAPLADRDARSLSGGEAQRVSIARALAVRPRVLLLDEPFTGLDATTRADLVADLRAVLDRQPTATVLVTHDRDEALALADHTALLIGGRLRAHGRTPEVLDRPLDADSARLLGFTNLFPPAPTGAGRMLAARPEHCRLAAGAAGPPAADGGAVRVAGTLRRAVRLGAVVRLDVDCPAGPVTCLHPPGEPGELPPPGSAVTVTARCTRPIT